MIVDSKNIKKRKRGVLLDTQYQTYITAFSIWLERLGYAKSTIKSNRLKLGYFFEYLQLLPLVSIYKIESIHITNYNIQLHTQKLSGSYIGSCIQAIRNFSRYLEATQYYPLPLCDLTIEKQEHQPFEVLTQKEIQHVFNSLENTLISMRDHAMLHLLYSCGLRREEVSRVGLKDIDYPKHLLYVQPGKTRQGRYVPLHPKVTSVLKDYELYARPIINANGKYFLVNTRNNECTPKVVDYSLQRILQNTSITKSISCHCLRHSIATHLLQQGMDIEYIKQFLGHKSLQTTQMYVRMNNELLDEKQTIK